MQDLLRTAVRIVYARALRRPGRAAGGGDTGGVFPHQRRRQTRRSAPTRRSARTSRPAWDLTGADHMDFVADTSLCLACAACPDGSADAAAVQAAARTLAAAFLLTHLADQQGLTASLDGDRVPAGVVATSRP